jgi:hypothetical protein
VDTTDSIYRHLDPDKIVDTADLLHRRIGERFADSGLGRVAGALVEVARHAGDLAGWLERPNRWLRAGAIVVVALLIAVVGGVLRSIDLNISLFSSVADFLQGLESAINDLVLLGLAIFFLATAETRLKRKRALAAIHELRSMAHIIDMHQLTKDPEQFAVGRVIMPSSPTRTLTPVELGRYLDYCSELLSIISKVAAVYVRRFDDPVTLVAVNEIENLTNGLSRKIWQKIMILDRILQSDPHRVIVAVSATAARE